MLCDRWQSAASQDEKARRLLPSLGLCSAAQLEALVAFRI